MKYRLSFNFERNEVSISENIRKTVYNNITSEEKLAKVNPENIQLGDDFLEYLTSIDRAKTTINSYDADLKVFYAFEQSSICRE